MTPSWFSKGKPNSRPNDSVRVFTAGGGGYGNPKERPVEEVAADLRDGLISRAAARSDYGVVFDDDLRVDQCGNRGAARARRCAA